MRASVLLLCLLLTACGSGNQPPANTPQTPAATPPAQSPAQTPTETPAETPKPPQPDPAVEPKPDSNAWRNLKRADPEGWVNLSADGRAELLKRVKKLPANFRYVAAITSNKAPGATEGTDEWDHWAESASGAVLYHVDTEFQPPADALQRFAGDVRDGDAEVQERDEVAFAELQEETVLMVAFANRLGTYVVIGLLSNQPDNRPAHRDAILQWAAAMQPE